MHTTTDAPAQVLAGSVFHLLREHARRWWYHAELRAQGQDARARALEHHAVRSNVEEIRAALENGGWLSVGRGGWTLHFAPHASLNGYGGPENDHIVAAAIRAGVPAWDSRPCPVDHVWRIAVNGPMPGFAADSEFPGPLSYVPWRQIADAYAAAGARVWNVR